jgi:opacity protein-like surface antigen
MKNATYIGLIALGFSATATADNDTWNGCFAGLHGGFAQVESSFRGTFFAGGPIDDDLGSVEGDGEFFGAQLGCRFQLGDSWVLGLRLSGSEGETDARHLYINGTGPTNFVSYESENLAALTSQLGVLIGDRSLVYLNLGYGRIDMLVEDTDPEYEEPIYFRRRDTLSDIMLGVGYEYRFSDRWSVFAEYNQIDFGTERDALLTDLSTWDINDYTADIGHEMDFVKLGVNFTF